MTSLTTVRVRYQTIEIGNTDIHLCTLRDNQQFSDPDDEALNLGICSASWPMFGVIWPSSLVLANHMLEYDIKDKRILAEFIERHALPTCEVIVVNPGRGRKNKLTNKMIEFCFSSKHVKPDNTTYLALPFKEHILTFSRSAV